MIRKQKNRKIHQDHEIFRETSNSVSRIESVVFYEEHLEVRVRRTLYQGEGRCSIDEPWVRTTIFKIKDEKLVYGGTVPTQVVEALLRPNRKQAEIM